MYQYQYHVSFSVQAARKPCPGLCLQAELNVGKIMGRSGTGEVETRFAINDCACLAW